MKEDKFWEKLNENDYNLGKVAFKRYVWIASSLLSWTISLQDTSSTEHSRAEQGS
jgi:hypothetical protein